MWHRTAGSAETEKLGVLERCGVQKRVRAIGDLEFKWGSDKTIKLMVIETGKVARVFGTSNTRG